MTVPFNAEKPLWLKKNNPKSDGCGKHFSNFICNIVWSASISVDAQKWAGSSFSSRFNHPLIFFDPSLLSAERADPTHDLRHLDTDKK